MIRKIHHSNPDITGMWQCYLKILHKNSSIDHNAKIDSFELLLQQFSGKCKSEKKFPDMLKWKNFVAALLKICKYCFRRGQSIAYPNAICDIMSILDICPDLSESLLQIPLKNPNNFSNDDICVESIPHYLSNVVFRKSTAGSYIKEYFRFKSIKNPVEAILRSMSIDLTMVFKDSFQDNSEFTQMSVLEMLLVFFGSNISNSDYNHIVQNLCLIV